MKISQHKTLAQTGKLGGTHKTGGKSTPQAFKHGGSPKLEKAEEKAENKGNPFAKGKAKPFGKKGC